MLKFLHKRNFYNWKKLTNQATHTRDLTFKNARKNNNLLYKEYILIVGVCINAEIGL